MVAAFVFFLFQASAENLLILPEILYPCNLVFLGVFYELQNTPYVIEIREGVCRAKSAKGD